MLTYLKYASRGSSQFVPPKSPQLHSLVIAPVHASGHADPPAGRYEYLLQSKHAQPAVPPSETVTENVLALPQQSVRLNETSTVEGMSVSPGHSHPVGHPPQQHAACSRLT